NIRLRFCPCHAGGQAAMARSRMVFVLSGTSKSSVTSNTRPIPEQVGQAPSGVFGEKASAYSMSCPTGYSPAREYSMRRPFEIVVTLPTDERTDGVRSEERRVGKTDRTGRQ